MLSINNEINHRKNNFSAIKPCECVSEKTLINSLITIATRICDNFNSFNNLFTTSKRNAKNVVRLIQTLLIFLMELRENQNLVQPGSGPVNPAFLDLHVVLQKLLHLFEDCTRPHARVCMVGNVDIVAGQFRILIGSLVEALERTDVDVDGDENEYVLFLIMQGKGVKFDVEKSDLTVKNLIFDVMRRVKDRVIPDPNDLRYVMDYLSIKSWSDCNEQVRFLEEWSDPDPQIRILLGFVIYCRCVIFQTVDDKEMRVESKNDVGFDVGCFNIDDFKCPISLELMEDPVTISSGHTYDRSSITKWFRLGNRVCPKTGQRLECLDLVSNLVVGKLIKQYSLQKGLSLGGVDAKCRGLTKSDKYKGNLVPKEVINMVGEFLSIKLALGTIKEKNKASYEIKLLAKRASFFECGVIHSLLNLLLLNDSTIQENAMGALWKLAKHPKNKIIIVDNGGLSLIIRVLKYGVRIEARHYAAKCLFYLSSIEEYRKLIGKNSDAVSSLVELIRVGSDKGKKNALITIFALLLHPNNHKKVIESSLIPLLIDLLDTKENKEVINNCLWILYALAEKSDGATTILKGRALNTIIDILCSSSSDSSRLAREICLSLLLALSTNGGKEVVQVLASKPSLMGILYTLISEGSPKASSLVKILHEFIDTRFNTSLAHALPHEPFIHVW